VTFCDNCLLQLTGSVDHVPTREQGVQRGYEQEYLTWDRTGLNIMKLVNWIENLPPLDCVKRQRTTTRRWRSKEAESVLGKRID
jgi:hypothetical protein